jgi:hypothetical protein
VTKTCTEICLNVIILLATHCRKQLTSFAVDDIEKEYQRLKSLGAALVGMDVLPEGVIS